MIREIFEEYEAQRYDIWQECFGDSREYIQMFFEETRRYVRVVGVIEDDELVSAAYLLPAEYVKSSTGRSKMYYLYAAATKMSCQGQGHFSRLLQWVFESMDAPVFLVPASEPLLAYYEKRGMRKVLEKEEIIYSGEGIEKNNASIKMDSVLVEEYLRKRDEKWLDTGYIRWDEKILQYIFKENVFCGGFCGKIVMGNQEAVFLARKRQKCLKILEIIYDGDLEEILRLLCQNTGCESVCICRWPTVCVEQDFPGEFGIGYFNLTMG